MKTTPRKKKAHDNNFKFGRVLGLGVGRSQQLVAVPISVPLEIYCVVPVVAEDYSDYSVTIATFALPAFPQPGRRLPGLCACEVARSPCRG